MIQDGLIGTRRGERRKYFFLQNKPRAVSHRPTTQRLSMAIIISTTYRSLKKRAESMQPRSERKEEDPSPNRGLFRLSLSLSLPFSSLFNVRTRVRRTPRTKQLSPRAEDGRVPCIPPSFPSFQRRFARRSSVRLLLGSDE